MKLLNDIPEYIICVHIDNLIAGLSSNALPREAIITTIDQVAATHPNTHSMWMGSELGTYHTIVRVVSNIINTYGKECLLDVLSLYKQSDRKAM